MTDCTHFIVRRIDRTECGPVHRCDTCKRLVHVETLDAQRWRLLTNMAMTLLVVAGIATATAFFLLRTSNYALRTRPEVAMPFLGGFDVVAASWDGPNAVLVTIDTPETDFYYQLYAGHTLIGQTGNTTSRSILGQLQPSSSPAPLTVVAVEAANLFNDYGAELPSWPSDRYELEFTTSGSPPDMDHFLITGSDGPGLSVDPARVLRRVPFIGDGPYVVPLPPLGQCGVWQFGVTAYDDSLPNGNPGTTSTVSVVATVPPADIVPDAQGNRFEAAASGGNLNISFSYP